jgi:hypothetical protein
VVEVVALAAQESITQMLQTEVVVVVDFHHQLLEQ